MTANVGLFSQYGFRSIAQTGGQPALQGGLDYGHSSGFYLGTWASNVSWLEDFGVYNRSSIEWDFYGGFKNTFPGSEDWSYDVGLYYYLYPGRKNPGALNADTFEGYGAIAWKWISAKASYSFTELFRRRADRTEDRRHLVHRLHRQLSRLAIPASRCSPITGFSSVPHDGSGNTKVAYDDWRIGLSYVVPEGLLKSVEIGAYYTGNTANEGFYTDLTGYNTAKDAGIVYIKKTF